ncbi:toxin-activating lysine-acyltransferase [uncultured Thalassolituus sp.]|uniref:toxin-activating lysine-acyltransferase n=1 Tax=uncultured Thalassolituus sp. TaxID=285273 RepID=UPI00262DBCC2|nr:toxin-activating lysine-acyltransferase [uncultured Thalassolituus sp.]
MSATYQKTSSATQFEVQAAGEKTLATVIGEIVWLFSQSASHRHLSIGDLEWAVMPPVLLDQYKIFKSEGQVVGVALWAYLSEEAEKKLMATSRLAPQDWGNDATISIEDGITPNEGGNLWLIEALAPFDSKENNHQQQMLVDLLEQDFSNSKLKTIQINPKTGQKEVLEIKGATHVD